MDWSVVHSLNTFLWHNDGLEDPLLEYVKLAEVLYLLLVVFLCAFARHARNAPLRRAGVAAALSAGLGLLVGQVITHFYDRPRPFVAHPHVLHVFARHAADASFPSDHATASMAIAVALLSRRRYGWGALALVFSAILDFGRVAVGWHYPTDVLGGAAIGALAALVLFAQPLRGWIDVISDVLGAIWDRALDAVLRALPLPRALRANRS